ncbi:alpha/beta hydrolase [Paucilactobacillus suebicus]|uniref:Alpha beta fold family hydrolase n=1 Tax=Paucilactobacillus suebicus DSM 5007 = KCTC 3549 TaxID=1423807 RepID=A0A0R1W1F6_9LACO|nr:alpha/beta hydrolase [Paucilactobacillus suebicus]KRM11413.1 alpha beta fold family hydrolase [Paucilactobacillus suebicus DSM 5007 = KCTC 3549]
MAFLEVKGAKLHYETVGQGPVLIVIPGANGTGNIFGGIAKYLQDRYTVVMFDRRGYGDTVMTEDLPAEATDYNSRYRLSTDANDVIALADKFSPDEPVFIMGSSSGSIVAAEAFTKAPDRFAKVAIHECPTSTVVDQKEARAKNIDAVESALSGDFNGAREKFAAAMNIQPLDAKMMGMSEDSPKPDEKRLAGMMYWFKYEVLQYTGQEIDWDVFKNNRDKVLLFNGTDSVGSTPQTVNKAISEMLNVPITIIPGGHLGYAQKPEGFAETLAAALDQR